MHLHLNYGGTFDPIHNGHLAVAHSAALQLDARVHLVPCADPPHRTPPVANATQRAQMVRLAIGDDPHLVLDTRELRRAGASYTLDTARELRAELGEGVAIACLIGADAFGGLHTWHGWRELFELTHLVALTRPGHSLDALAPELDEALRPRWSASRSALRGAPAGAVIELQVPTWDVSSTAVRAALATGEPLQRWVPAAVLDWIALNGVYGGLLQPR
jgi:nicotinate-nucleotide adenylyltransferase